MQGFGRRLMFGCEAYAAELGLTKISASVDSSQKRLLDFYLNLGGVIQTNSAHLDHLPLPKSACLAHALLHSSCTAVAAKSCDITVWKNSVAPVYAQLGSDIVATWPTGCVQHGSSTLCVAQPPLTTVCPE